MSCAASNMVAAGGNRLVPEWKIVHPGGFWSACQRNREMARVRCRWRGCDASFRPMDRVLARRHELDHLDRPAREIASARDQ